MNIEMNITSIFMIPTLKIPKNSLRENGIINGYIKDEDRDVQYENCIYLLFKPKDIDKFRNFLNSEYERTKSVIDDYDYDDGYVVVVYQLDNKHSSDFELIRKGKYSKTSTAFQKLFPKIVKIKKNGLYKDEISLQYRVFNRTEDLIRFWEEKLGVKFDDDQEVWYAFDEEKEILNINNIKENVQRSIVPENGK
jgi:hypothetical protein